MNTSNRRSKYLYIILGVVVLIAGGLVYYKYWSRSRSQPELTNSVTSQQNVSTSTGNMFTSSGIACSTSTGSDGTMALPNISTPPGWKGDNTGVFYPTTVSTGSNMAPMIQVAIAKYKDSAEESLNSSGKYSPFTNTQNWNIINGYFILESSYPGFVQYEILVRNGSCPDYGYTFDLSYYAPNGPSGPIQVSVNPSDVEILQSMVKDFAESLPSGI